MMAWFTTAQGDDLNDTLERAAHQAPTEFCEGHLLVLSDTAIALLPIWNGGNTVWSEHVSVIGDPELLTNHAGWMLTARYAQHVSSLLQEVIATGAHLRLRLEECASQVQAMNRVLKDIRELLQKNAHLETCIRELNDELMTTYRNRDFKTDDLDDTRTRVQHALDELTATQYAQDELTAAQSYIHHLETELYERDEQLEASQAQAADLQHEVEHLQELIPPEPKEPEEPEEDPEEIEGMSAVDDD
jgi:chromosome segregation ATPase